MDFVYYTVISCFSAFLLGIAFGMVFLIERAGKKMFQDSVD